MIIGIDVGGTHTDGVLLHDGCVQKTVKVVTRRDALAESILAALDGLLSGEVADQIRRIVFSTTLTTNLIAQASYPPVGLALIPGPGLPVDGLLIGAQNWVLSGSVDHRGRLVAGLHEMELRTMASDLRDTGIRHLAIVGKFSTRNPQLEEAVEHDIREHVPQIEQIQLGHRIATSLNFPRRVRTTWLNTAVYEEYTRFLTQVQTAVQERGLHRAHLFLLKADGGTMPLEEGLRLGVETIKSGPAASIMGFLALAQEEKRTSLLLDIGGSTTDLALMTDGVPLLEPEGVQVGDDLTSVRGLLSRSLPYGGDSPLVVQDGQVLLSPKRRGAAILFGGTEPTLTDALAVLGFVQSAYTAKVRDTFQGLGRNLLTSSSAHPEDVAEYIAQCAIQYFCTQVHEGVTTLVQEINQRPVYTIHELLTDGQLQPEVMMVVGGPAEALLSALTKELELEPVLPAYHFVANALGAAMARPTFRQMLYADTAQKFYTLTGLPGKQRMTGRFSLADARHILLEHTRTLAKGIADIQSVQEQVELTHEECFHIVRGFSTEGQIIKLEARIKPGIINWIKPERWDQE